MESALTDAGDTLGDGDGGQVCALVESAIGNQTRMLGYRKSTLVVLVHTNETTIEIQSAIDPRGRRVVPGRVLKGIRTNMLDAIRDMDARQTRAVLEGPIRDGCERGRESDGSE